MLADTEWLRFIFFPIFHNMCITAMIKMSEDIKNKAWENLFCYSVWIGGMKHSCILFNI